MKSLLVTSIFTLSFMCYFAWTGFSQLPKDMEEIELGIQSVKWPTTTAVITDHRVEVTDGGKRGLEYTPHLNYKFQVNGKERSGDRTAFGQVLEHTYKNSEDASAANQKFPLRSKHTVHYSPTDPAKSVLVPGVSIENTYMKSVTFLALAVNMLSMGIFLALFLNTPLRKLSYMPTVFIIVSSILTVYGTNSIQHFVISSKVPKNAVLRTEQNAYFLGEKKFAY